MKMLKLLTLLCTKNTNRQAGFTLIGLLVTLAISALIAAGAGMTAVQTLKVTQASKEHTASARQAQNFGSLISQDLLMAETASTSDDPAAPEIEFITLQWKDVETGYVCEVSYIWLDSGDSTKKVVRHETIYDEEGIPTSNASTLIADHVFSASLSQQDEAFTLSVETKAGQQTETKQYDIIRRAES
jgi:prepilin-type N-terminal cleavage/methylation domain-containing protein